MITELQIKNIAVIEQASIEFGPGLNVMTGETGAGKSIVIDSLGAVIGSRVGKDMLRFGAEKGMVTAVFHTHIADQWLEENDIDCDDGEIIVQRKVTADGKNSCRVCGTPISVSQLKELGNLLLDIHGQNDGRLLMDETKHLQYLDTYGDYKDLLGDYHKEYEKYNLLKKKLQKMAMNESDRLQRIDNLQFIIKELTDADLVEGEEAEKTERRDLLHNAEKISEYINTAYEDLAGAEINAADLASDAENLLMRASTLSESLQEVAAIVGEAGSLLNDASERISDFRQSLDFSPQEYDELELRLSQLRRLQRKYMLDESGLIQKLRESEDELNELQYSSDITDQLQKEIDDQAQICIKIADRLTENRIKCASILEKNIEHELKDLNMPSVVFKVEMLPVSNEMGFDRNGKENVVFLMSANAGEKPGRIAKIASGGELSRIMLAMKNVFSRNDTVESLVFDEIDAGISGLAAQRVGEKLSDVAANRQVICVTHLSQLAVMADNHYLIEKHETDGRTFTDISKLSNEERRYEVARLHGGEHITDLTLASAQDQIDAAEKYKRNRMIKEN